MKFVNSKLGSSPWISWVLLVAFVVALSAFMYDFMTGHTESQTEDIKKIVYNSDECRLVSINIKNACSGAQALNITLENTNYIRITKTDFRLYSGAIPIHTNYTNISMNPNREKIISLNTGVASTPTLVEVIPHIEMDNLDIVCADRKAQKTVSSC